jgi:predicted ABC-type ATPase
MLNLYIIAGCNGAGKTTASFTILPEMLNCREFVNADNIAAGISPFNPESVAVEAGRVMLSRIQELMKGRVDFAFETTLATRSYVSLVRSAQEAGYKLPCSLSGWIRRKRQCEGLLIVSPKVGMTFLMTLLSGVIIVAYII